MDKIIFLDIDGVLKLDGEDCFDKDAVKNLTDIINQTGCKIVLSSNWRISGIGPSSPVQRYLKASGGDLIGQSIIGITDLDGYKRGIQIKQWLIDNDFSGNFVVIDDIVWDMEDIKDCIWVDKDVGFTQHNAKQAIDILNKGY
jgi:hypothetical protein